MIQSPKFYINEQSGDDNNDGTQIKPWRTFKNIISNSNIYIVGTFTTELILQDINNVIIIGDNINPMSVVPNPINIDNINNPEEFRNTYVQKIIDNPTPEKVGAPIPNAPGYKIREVKMQNRVYSSKVVSINLTNCNNLIVIGLSVSVSNSLAPLTVKKGIKLTNCKNCIIQNCELYSSKNVENWTADDWNNNEGGLTVLYGSSNKILNNNIYNCGGIQIAGVNSIVSNNFITDFPKDGSGLWSNNNLFINNRVQNSKLVNKNHDDMLQSSVCKNNNIINNVFIAYTDNKAPFYNTSVQAIGCFDGWYNNYLIKDNYVFNDHPIGIWLMGADSCIIDSNTVRICGLAWNKRRTPCILLGPKKTGELSKNNVVINNIAPHLELQTEGGLYKNNYSLDIGKFIN